MRHGCMVRLFMWYGLAGQRLTCKKNETADRRVKNKRQKLHICCIFYNICN